MFVEQGRYQEAERYFKKAVEMAKLGFGEQEAHVASSLNNLAEFYRIRRQYDLAEPLYQQVILVGGLRDDPSQRWAPGIGRWRRMQASGGKFC